MRNPVCFKLKMVLSAYPMILLHGNVTQSILILSFFTLQYQIQISSEFFATPFAWRFCSKPRFIPSCLWLLWQQIHLYRVKLSLVLNLHKYRRAVWIFNIKSTLLNTAETGFSQLKILCVLSFLKPVLRTFCGSSKHSAFKRHRRFVDIMCYVLIWPGNIWPSDFNTTKNILKIYTLHLNHWWCIKT